MTTTSRKAALAALIDAVEAGDDASFEAARHNINRQSRDEGKYFPALEIYKAYWGSLDAARELHNAVLPGWSVDDFSQSGKAAGHPWGIRLAYWDGSNPNNNRYVTAGWGHDATPDNNPARAWLLAILKAMHALEADE